MGHDSTVWSLSFSSDGRHLASVGEDRTLRVWECGERDGEPFYRFVCVEQGEHGRAVYSVAWGEDGIIATGCGAHLLPETSAPPGNTHAQCWHLHCASRQSWLRLSGFSCDAAHTIFMRW